MTLVRSLLPARVAGLVHGHLGRFRRGRAGAGRAGAGTVRRASAPHDEALATDGDIRRLCALFDLSIGGAERYAHTTDQPGVG